VPLFTTGILKSPHMGDQPAPIDISSIQINPDLTKGTRTDLENLIKKHTDLFQWDPRTNLGRTKRVKFDIDTGNAAPIRQQQFPHPEKIHEKIKTRVDEMLDLEVIKPIESEWSSPCFLATKKNAAGEWTPHGRFVIDDVRGLTSVTKKITYPSTRIEDILNKIRSAKYYTTLDFSAGYWQSFQSSTC
jgi:hypothetical protein